MEEHLSLKNGDASEKRNGKVDVTITGSAKREERPLA